MQANALLCLTLTLTLLPALPLLGQQEGSPASTKFTMWATVADARSFGGLALAIQLGKVR